MGIDIAAMDAATKLAFAQAVGSVKLSSRVISSPVDSVDIALPTGYDSFELRIRDMRFTNPSSEELCGAWSLDGGTTFVCDIDNADTYLPAALQMGGGGTTTFPASPSLAPSFADADSLFFMTPVPHDDVPGIINLLIEPGSASAFPVIQHTCAMATVASWLNSPVYMAGVSGINPDATVPAMKGRANVLRLAAYGNGDFNDYETSVQIVSGSFTLVGCA